MTNRTGAVSITKYGPDPLPVPGRLPRVHRIHGITCGDQRRHPRTPVSLDPDHHLIRPGIRISEPADQLMEPPDPRHALRQPGPPQHPARPVLHLHIMMIFSPVITSEQQPRPPSLASQPATAGGEQPAA
jgi:hypothetical protein